MAGVKELSEVVLFFAKLGTALGKAQQDGEITMGDLSEFLPVMSALPDALIGISDIGDEILDLDHNEMAMLVDELKKELDLPDDDIEFLIEGAAEMAVKLVDIVEVLRK